MQKDQAALDRLIIAAAEAGVIKAVEAALEAGASADATGQYGVTALHEAALHGYLDIVELLVDRGAYVDAVTIRGFTPLTWAIQEGHKEIEMFLRSKGTTT